MIFESFFTIVNKVMFNLIRYSYHEPQILSDKQLFFQNYVFGLKVFLFFFFETFVLYI